MTKIINSKSKSYSTNPESKRGFILRWAILLAIIVSYTIPNFLIYSPYIFHYIIQLTLVLFTWVIISLPSIKYQIVNSSKPILATAFILITISLIGALHSQIIGINIYDYRDLIRPIVIALLIVSIHASSKSFNINYLAKNIFWFCVIFILINSLLSILWLFDRGLAENILSVFIAQGNPVFVEGYWRFTGLLGQPNFNAIALATVATYVSTYQSGSGALKIIVLIIGIPPTFLSSSRTVMAAIFVIIALILFWHLMRGVFLLKIDKKIIIFATSILLIILPVMYKFNETISYFSGRLFSAFNYIDDERFYLLSHAIQYFFHRPNQFLFGKLGDINIHGYTFVDNDYLLIVAKHGLVMLLFCMVMFFLVLKKSMRIIKSGEHSKRYGMGYFVLFFLIFLLISSIGSPVLSVPQLFFMPLVLMVLLFSSQYKPIINR